MSNSIIANSVFQKKAIRTSVIVSMVLIMLLAGFTPGSASGTPFTTIVSVDKDVSVTISGINFPADQTFTVRMGAFGSLGVGGTIVGTKEPSSSTSFTATYNIPASLMGASKIAIRFDSSKGYYAYDWFVNNPAAATATTGPTATSGPTQTPGPTKTPGPTNTPGPSPTPKPTSAYKGPIPTITIVGVQQGVNVSLVTKDYPAGQTFTVRIGEYGTLGIGGTIVGTLNSGAGGVISQSFTIPAALASRAKLSIRLDSPLGYYSYDWFNNNASFGTTAGTAIVTATAGPTATPGGPTATPSAIPTAGSTSGVPVAGYLGIPTFTISSVVKDQSVTISAVNFPPGQVFTVRMGAFGTMAIGGTLITTSNSGAGGSFTATYPIPAVIAGNSKIAIRLETGYYYAYNWFWNN